MARFFSYPLQINHYSEKASPDEIEVWVNRSRQYVDLIQQITDDVLQVNMVLKLKFRL